MAPNSGYYGTPFPGGWSALKGAPIPGGWSALMGEDFLNSKIQEILGNGNKLTENIGQTSNRDPLMTETVVPGGLTQKQLIEQLESFKALDALAKREELGYPTPSAPVQGVTSTDIPAQTGMRPDPRIVGREEMVAENIKRALGRNRMMMAPVVPGSLNQEQFMKELKEIQALTTPAPAPTAAEDTGSISDVLGAPQRVYDPEQGRFVPKWDLSKIDPRYGLQSYEAIQSYLERMENQPQVAPQQVAAAAARQAPVSPVAARPSSPTPGGLPVSSQTGRGGGSVGRRVRPSTESTQATIERGRQTLLEQQRRNQQSGRFYDPMNLWTYSIWNPRNPLYRAIEEKLSGR